MTQQLGKGVANQKESLSVRMVIAGKCNQMFLETRLREHTRDKEHALTLVIHIVNCPRRSVVWW
jgi:hypothetical protein